MNAEPFEIELGKRLETLRKAKGKTQDEAAAELGLKSRETVKQWESWDRHIKANDLRKLCEYYNVSADILLGLPTDTNANDAAEFTGLSVEAIEQLHRLTQRSYEWKHISRLIARFGRIFNDDLYRIESATQSAGMYVSGDPDPEDYFELGKAKADLELALFAFEQLCRDIYSEFGSAAVLRQITEAENTLLHRGEYDR